MKTRYRMVMTTLLLSLLSANAQGAANIHWDYSEDGPEGPKNWGKLAPEFGVCGSGMNQSPVDLDGMIESNLPFISFNYQKGGSDVVNNGHSIQVNYTPGSTITVSDHSYELKQLHFHTPSENTIKGEYWPMEAHFVHADEAGNLAVIALMFRTGDDNTELAKAWDVMPEKVGDTAPPKEPLDGAALLPENKDYYRFNGSLTTPPCSEGVLWLVLKADVTASVAQIDKFAKTMHHPNNRPVQPTNARAILQ